MSDSPRIHEWAWGDTRRRTVCGLTQGLLVKTVVADLGAVEPAQRCRNCERMRAAIGESSRAAGSGETPPAAPVARAVLSERELDVLQHTTGWLSRTPLYRNHFCASEGHADWTTLQGLVERGLMNVAREPAPLAGGDTTFCATAAGIAAIKGSRGRAPSGSAQQSE